ncbi:MAG TPA: sulfatase-like hydrolase/transferase [Gemmataceae bacterium]
MRFVLVLAACGLATHPQVAAADKPNILFVLTDDQRWDTIHALGNPEVHTPVEDRLVEDGFTFTNAYCQGSMVGAVCLPSRTMLITGQSLWHCPQQMRAKTCPPGTPLLPKVMAGAGYVTWHCGKSGNASPFGNAAFQTNIIIDRRVPTTSQECADKAIAFLKSHDAARPFFMYLAPPVPHDPRVAPERFVKMYDPAKITLSKNFMPRHPFDNGELAVRDELLAPIPRTPAEMRRHLADYYAAISNFDFELGRILDTLKDRGLAGNTVVIYSSDQGLAVGGRHGLMGKQNLYEHVKPPLVVTGRPAARVPRIPHGRSDALVYLYDLFPTICELGGATVPAAVEGKSLLPVMKGQVPRVRETLFGAYKDCQRMIRDERWKLIKYNAKGVRNVQLFDLRNDPDELNNLADDPKHAGERARLEKLLAEARKQFGDPVDFDGPGTPNPP